MQELFAHKVIELEGNATKAYPAAGYSVKNKTEKTINEAASRLRNNSKVAARINELQAELRGKALHTLEKSLELDIEMVERYKKHIAVLEDEDATEKQIKVARRSMNYIGASAFNAAQERIAKKSGFYEKDKDKPQIIYTVQVTKEEAQQIAKDLEDEI